jgi:hypothetical protein
MKDETRIRVPYSGASHKAIIGKRETATADTAADNAATLEEDRSITAERLSRVHAQTKAKLEYVRRRYPEYASSIERKMDAVDGELARQSRRAEIISQARTLAGEIEDEESRNA